MTRVCHLSSAHRGLDIRICHKQCASLAAVGYDTHLVIVASNQEVAKAKVLGVTVHVLQAPVGRFSRMVRQSWRCFVVGRSLDADIYHFHDPELIPYGIWLALSGKKVIYDVHEDVPQDILTKDWIAPWIRKGVSVAISALEYLGARYFFSIAAATPYIAQRFKKITPRSVDINNYPVLDELSSDTLDWSVKQNQICYIGGIGRIRGIAEITQAMGLVRSGVRLNLCGQFSEPDMEQTCKAMPGWQRVNALGFLDRMGVRDVLGRSVAGLVTLHPVINYLDALPVKMFEYMAAGIPVVASDFPLWREIIAGNDCGLLVDPLDPATIAQAIDYLVTHPEEAQRMGANGRKAVIERYNWANEQQKLFTFYEHILSKPL
jgi:glycosyltransferase involved in cell wall biosynthesis